MDGKYLCLDTDVIIAFFKGDKKVKEVLETFPGDIVTTSVNVMELLTYAKKERREKYLQFLYGIKILSFDFRSAIIAANIIRDLKEKGLMIDIRDILIGSICIAKNVPLFTYNIKHFERLKEYGLVLFQI